MQTAEIFAFASALSAGVLALIASLRAGRSIAHWAFVGGLLALSLESTFSGLALLATTSAETDRWLHRSGLISAFVPGVWFLFSLTYARENAREFLHRWQWLLVTALVLPGGLALLSPESLPQLEYMPRPGLDPLPIYTLGNLGALLHLILLLSTILILMNLERTIRAAIGLIRWRIKFMIMGVGVLFIIRLFTLSQALIYRQINQSLDALNSVALLVASALILRSLFRTERFAQYVHPSHSILQGSVTVVLAGVYLVLVGLLASLATYFGGDDLFALKAFIVLLAIVGLTVLLQSDRVNLYLRRFVSRHFKRPLYDYQTVWSRFTQATTSQLEQTEYCQAVVKLLADTFQALCVSLWLVDDRRNELHLAASTSLSADRARELKPDSTGTTLVTHYLGTHHDPVDIEHRQEIWATILRRCHPDEFHKGGTRICVPIVSGGETLALILLGDRVGGAAFTLQDHDLLKSIGEHVSSGLLNTRLSQRLLQAREHEAFQTMATFFVHDLKNAASSLSLMLQNLPTHFDDPEFRADALRGVGKSVAHINNLINRLSQLRQELKIQPTECDLNEIVANALAGFTSAPGFTLETELTPIPKLAIDREQFTKVLTNLVLNAREAKKETGRLRVSTSSSGAWVVLTAADDGVGMTEEFLTRSLFRPFQTTKTNGLGIGMFQSKMIVEAHGGRITVESTPGQGTTFRISLPLPPLPPL